MHRRPAVIAAAGLLAATTAAVPLVLAPRGVGAQTRAAQQGQAGSAGRTGSGTATTPRQLGSFGAWTAATYANGGQKVCYAFARATRSEPPRQGVMLMVTHRAGQSRDELAMRAGHTYARGAPEVTLAVGSTEIHLYTGGESAYARAGDRRAAVTALRAARQEAVARGPAPGGRGQATDYFPVNGFSAAYDAISRECPAASGGRRR